MTATLPETSEALLSTLADRASPAHAALVVVDVQNDFVAENGFYHRVGSDITTVQRIMPPLERLIAAARAAGVLVVFIQAIYDAPYVSAPMRERNRRRKAEMPRCITGTWGADFHRVKPAPGEPVVIKHRYSAFTNPELDKLLKARGIRSLLLTGVATDVCVESTGRDGYFIDYYVTMIGDCCAAGSQRDHQGALDRFARDYGVVAASSDIIAGWQGETAGAEPSLAAAAPERV